MIKSSGNFYIKKDGSNTGHWNVYYQHYDNGKRKQESVKKYAYPELGFRSDMTLDQARERCKQINSERGIEKSKIKKAADRVIELVILDETLFPKTHVNEFLQKLENENFGSDYNFQKTLIYFKFVQKMVVSLKLTNPSDYKEESKSIYKYFLKNKISHSYTMKILSVLNRWGKFQARYRGSFFEPVSIPKGREKSAIQEAHHSKVGAKTASEPLTPQILESIKSNITVEQYNWLYLSIWLGLRPEEIENLHNPKFYKITHDQGSDLTVISIYQSKLMSVEEKLRWKHIPLIFNEQIKIIDIIKDRDFKKPLNKTIKKYTNNPKITLYGGRKNFVDLCLDRNQTFIDIAAWLGHQNTTTTFKHYKQRDIVRHTPIVESSSTRRGFKVG